MCHFVSSHLISSHRISFHHHISSLAAAGILWLCMSTQRASIRLGWPASNCVCCREQASTLESLRMFRLGTHSTSREADPRQSVVYRPVMAHIPRVGCLVRMTSLLTASLTYRQELSQVDTSSSRLYKSLRYSPSTSLIPSLRHTHIDSLTCLLVVRRRQWWNGFLVLVYISSCHQGADSHRWTSTDVNFSFVFNTCIRR